MRLVLIEPFDRRDYDLRVFECRRCWYSENLISKAVVSQAQGLAKRSLQLCQLALADNFAIPLAGTANLFIGTLMRLGSLI